MKHGRRSTYVALRCRCPLCRQANADYQRQLRSVVRLPVPDGQPHGAHDTYLQYGCRCVACRRTQRNLTRHQTKQERTMTAPKPVDLVVSAANDAVYLVYADSTEYMVLPPEQARTLAAELLTNADRAENKLPATTYRVDRR